MRSHIEFTDKSGVTYTLPVASLVLSKRGAMCEVGNVNVIDAWLEISEEEYLKIRGIIFEEPPTTRPAPLSPSPSNSNFTGSTI